MTESKRERLFAAITREGSDASLARAGAQGRYLSAHRLARHQAFARKGGKSLIDRAEVTAARAKIRLLEGNHGAAGGGNEKARRCVRVRADARGTDIVATVGI